MTPLSANCDAIYEKGVSSVLRGILERSGVME